MIRTADMKEQEENGLTHQGARAARQKHPQRDDERDGHADAEELGGREMPGRGKARRCSFSHALG